MHGHGVDEDTSQLKVGAAVASRCAGHASFFSWWSRNSVWLRLDAVVAKQVDATRIADATAWISRRTLDAARDVVRYHAERTTTASSRSQTLFLDHQEKKLA